MKKHLPEKFLVIRFRQMGDAVLATSLLNAIKLNFPESETDFVLNERIAPLFSTHPAVDRIITFSDKERHSPLVYLRKIWRIMRRGRYDVVIDMRSTANTLPFSLFSLRSRFRIGIRKAYTGLLFNYRFPECGPSDNMVSHDVRLLSPLGRLQPLLGCDEISLHVTDGEMASYREYLQGCGVDLSRPVLLCGVVTKLAYKCWPRENMVEVLRRLIDAYPGLQLVFNYAPGEEECTARSIYSELGSPANVFVNVSASDMRQLVCLCRCCSGYFGNEGGARHIAHASGCPSLVVVSPAVSKVNWLPRNSVFAEGVAVSDMVSAKKLENMTYGEKYACITPDYVWERLDAFVRAHLL